LSFELEHIGEDLAYLLGAMLQGECCAWPEHRPLVKLLRKRFPKTHIVWDYISIDEEA
jgi:hypothetical protein